jgi:hypothetical protein
MNGCWPAALVPEPLACQRAQHAEHGGQAFGFPRLLGGRPGADAEFAVG